MQARACIASQTVLSDIGNRREVGLAQRDAYSVETRFAHTANAGRQCFVRLRDMLALVDKFARG